MCVCAILKFTFSLILENALYYFKDNLYVSPLLNCKIFKKSTTQTVVDYFCLYWRLSSSINRVCDKWYFALILVHVLANTHSILHVFCLTETVEILLKSYTRHEPLNLSGQIEYLKFSHILSLMCFTKRKRQKNFPL